MTRPRSGRVLASLLGLLLAMTALALPQVAAEAAPTAAAALRCSGTSTDLDGLAADAHPVVLVHGWADGPLTATAKGLRRQGWQYLTFDYSDDATRWAAAPQVSACLARYVDQVSRRHRERGGDGIVYLVGHSMGGNAIQFALDPAYGRIPGLADRVGGVVALATPFEGSAWGGSNVAEWWSENRGTSPSSESRAWACLSKQRPRGCEAPPAIPARVPVHEVIGMVTVRRAMFGVLAYDVPLSGDGVVSQASQLGYADAGRAAVPFDTVACTASTDRVLGAVRAGLDPVAFWTFADDAEALDLFGAEKAGVTAENLPAVAQYGHVLLDVASCSHMRIPKDREAQGFVNRALDGMAARRAGITSADQLRSAPIPATCRHEATRVSGGTKDFGQAPGGPYRGFATLGLGQADAEAIKVDPVLADVDDDGVTDGVVAMLCSAGGVTWPMQVLVYGHGPRLTGQIDLALKGTRAEHADLTSMRAGDGGIELAWNTYEGAGFDVRSWSGVARLVLGGGTRRWELQGITETGPRTVDVTAGLLGDRDAVDAALSDTDAGFVTFVSDLVDEQVTLGQECGAESGVTVDRWRSDGWAVGSVNACGGYQAIWGEEDGAWREVLGTQEGWGCAELDSAGVPRALVDDECA